jgi:RNA polymerase sigma-70 factor (ECF subfamily)
VERVSGVTKVHSEVQPPAWAGCPDELASTPDDRVTIRPEETFDAFYRRVYPGLVAVARALSRGTPSAEDIAQEAMLVVYRKWDEVVRLDYPEAWTRRVCANLATSSARRRQAELRALLRLSGRRQESIPLGETSERFWAQVRRLPRRQAQCVALFYALDLTVEDVALTLDVSAGTVKIHLSRARASLAVLIDQNEDVS